MRIVKSNANDVKSRVATKGKPDVRASKRMPNDRAEAIDYIKSAISVLGDSAIAGDEVAKEAIANLGVIALDLT